MVVRAERGEEAILRWWCSQPGTSAVRRDMSVRRACETKGEVLEVFEEEDEHHVQQGLYSLPCAGTHSLENHPGVSEVLRLQPGHKFKLVGHLSTEVGWHHYDTIKELQEKQKAKSKVFYECKKHLIQFHLKAAKCVEEQISPLQETLVPISYKA
ncbi:unnamed protein product [Sphagnum troendelagicum]|uniref:Uncharacterized protein n=1 Tax=Sphagnum troendelagicum TaxID=128251 RepID=A0ABP0TR97_9BRYO